MCSTLKPIYLVYLDFYIEDPNQHTQNIALYPDLSFMLKPNGLERVYLFSVCKALRYFFIFEEPCFSSLNLYCLDISIM